MAEVVLDLAGHPLVAAITTDSVDRLKLQEGDLVHAVIKATEVMIAH